MTKALQAFLMPYIASRGTLFFIQHLRFSRLLILAFLFFIHSATKAATITSNNITGFWDVGGTWVGGVAPGPGDDVIINASATITVRTNVSCLSLSWTGNPSAARTLTINAGFTLTVNGNITISPPTSNNRNRTISVLGTLDCTGTFTMQASTDDRRRCILSIGTNGVASITGNLIMLTTIARNWVQMTGSAVFNLGGNLGGNATGTSGGGGFVTPTTVNFNGTLPQNFFPQTSVAIPTFKVNNAAGLIMRVAQSVTTLTIGDITSNSLFKDSGNTVTSSGTLNLLNGSTYRLGRYSGTGGTATTFPAFATNDIDLGTTIEYAHINADQTVSTTPQYANLTFSSTVARSRIIAAGTLTVRQNLTIGANTTFLGSTNNPTTNLGGNFSNSGTFTSGSGLFTMNGTTNQSITGTALFAGGLTINNTGGGGSNTVTLNNNITTTGDLTLTNGILDLGAFTANRTAGGGTMTISNGTRLIIGGTNSLPTNYTTHVIGATSTVEYDGTTNNVTAPNGGVAYGNLEIDATGATTSASFPVSGVLSVLASRSFVASTGTITMSGASGAINNASGTLTFNDLSITGTTISSTGNFAVAGTMTVSTIFTPSATSIISGAGTLTGNGTVNVTRTAATPSFGVQYTITNKTLTNLTVNYNGAGAQTVDAQNYGNLTISTNGTRTVTFINGGTIRVSGVFTPTATTTTYVVTNNTFEYNGAGAQNIAAFTYHNLIISNAGIKTVLAGTTVNCQTITMNDAAILTLPDTSILNVTL
jgi:hypothetical protein